MRSVALLALLVAGACGSADQEVPHQSTPVTGVDSTFTENGMQRVRLKDGIIAEGEMKDGERVGVWRSHLPNGKLLSQIEYRNGRKHGPTVVYHPNGAVRYTGAYEDDQPSGTWRFYDKEGELVRELERTATGDAGS
ncbi:MAG: hypothetical protein KDB88_04190 [Flavobacteriales bacterium]|nr:hypothetical protein [Flavobacteriales bacterium]